MSLVPEPVEGRVPRRTVIDRTRNVGCDAGVVRESTEPMTERGFVGRVWELEQLSRAADEVAAGRGQVLLLSGEAGIGKTRLAAELTGGARERGWLVLSGRCWEEGGAPPFWPWSHAFGEHVASCDPDELSRTVGVDAALLVHIVPELEGMVGNGATGSRAAEVPRVRIFDAFARFVRRVAAVRPLLLVLDDLHAADAPSLLLLHYVAREISDASVALVAVFRPIEESTSAVVAETFSLLARDPSTTSVRLHGLVGPDVAALIERSLGDHLSPLVLRAVEEQTGGNPLFVSEVARLFAGARRTSSGVGRAASWDRIPTTLRSVIDLRINALSPLCVETLRVASVLGSSFSAGSVGRLADQHSDVVRRDLDEALGANLIELGSAAPGELRFSHGLVRERLHASLPADERRRLHSAAGAMLGTRPGGLAQVAKLAHHLLLAAEPGHAREAILEACSAAKLAAGHYAHEEAIRLYLAALEVVVDHDGEADDVLRSDILMSLGESQARVGDLAAAKATFLDAAVSAERTGRAEQVAQAALGYGGRYVWGRAVGDDDLIPMLERALDGLSMVDSPLRARVLGRLACARRGEPDRAASAALSMEAVSVAERLGDDETLAYALEAHHGATLWCDNTLQRLQLAERQLAIATQAGDDERMANVHLCRTSALLELGDIAGAEAALRTASAIADRIDEPAYQAMTLSVRAMLALLRGEFTLAGELITRERDIGRASLTAETDTWVIAHAAWLQRELGQLDGLPEVLQSAADAQPWYPFLRCMLAVVHVATGDHQRARAILADLAPAGVPALPPDNEWLLGMTLLADVASDLADRHRSEAFYELLAPHTGRNIIGFSELSCGSVDRPLGRLAAVLDDLERAERHLRAAVAFDEGIGARPWLVRSRLALADVLTRRGTEADHAEATHLITTARTAAAQLGMVLNTTVEEPVAPVALPTREPATFRREGDSWTVAYRGSLFRVADAKGMRHLAVLLSRPDQDVHVLELTTAGPPGRPAKIEEQSHHLDVGDLGPQLDATAKAAYRRRLADLASEIEEAEAWNDGERAERAHAEVNAITEQLSAAFGLGGRDRPVGSLSERARINVSRAVKAAVARLATHSPELGDHLDRTIHTGTYCTYRPDPRARPHWEL